ncbi:hypothetical protein V8G54_023073 [Vigna mungo]|uniref:Uncharacterized protein n=1 Tax=Vigna mungo TaxID=3915 RepID=A0AAQ3RPZ6_VIGMU
MEEDRMVIGAVILCVLMMRWKGSDMVLREEEERVKGCLKLVGSATVVKRKQICNGREKRDGIEGDGTANNSGRLASLSFFATEKNQGFGGTGWAISALVMEIGK